MGDGGWVDIFQGVKKKAFLIKNLNVGTNFKWLYRECRSEMNSVMIIHDASVLSLRAKEPSQ